MMTQTRRKAGVGLAMLAAGALLIAPYRANEARAGALTDAFRGIQALGAMESQNPDRPYENRQKILGGVEALEVVGDALDTEEDRDAMLEAQRIRAQGERDAARINQQRTITVVRPTTPVVEVDLRGLNQAHRNEEVMKWLYTSDNGTLTARTEEGVVYYDRNKLIGIYESHLKPTVEKKKESIRGAIRTSNEFMREAEKYNGILKN